MKKIIILLLSGLSILITAQNVYIPDLTFKNYLLSHSGINTNGDNEIQFSEAESFNGTIDYTGISNKIADLTGIEKFVKLKELSLWENSLESLDLSKNLDLEVLYCGGNKLKSLIVGNNTNLKYLELPENELTNLDISKNTALILINCSFNQLASLDVSKNSDLQILLCEYNQLTNINVSQNTVLKELICNNNQLKNLNLKNGNNSAMASLTPNGMGDDGSDAAMYARSNSNLTCIQVDNAVNASSYNNWYKDTTTIYSTDCNYLSITKLNKAEIYLYPNPIKNILNFSQEVYNVKIKDISGKNIKQFPAGSKSINIANLTKGIYIISATTKSMEVITKKIVKE